MMCVDSVSVLVELNGRCSLKNMFCRFIMFSFIGCYLWLVMVVVLIG